MAELQPWDLDPDHEGLRPFDCYWAVAMMDAAYHSTISEKVTLAQLVPTFHLHHHFTRNHESQPNFDYYEFSDNKKMVVVEGTTRVEQLIHEMLGAQLLAAPPWPGHVGIYFAQAADEIYTRLRETFLDLEGSRWLCLGHSLGGAIATLLPRLLEQITLSEAQGIISAGSPRAGSVEFAAIENYAHTRLTNQGDPVPLVPPSRSVLLDGALWVTPWRNFPTWHHAGRRFHLWRDGGFTVPPEAANLNTEIEALHALALASTVSFAPHLIGEYARRLRLQLPLPLFLARPDFPGLDVIDNYWQNRPTVPAVSQWEDELTCG